jgi:hypothetical protein
LELAYNIFLGVGVGQKLPLRKHQDFLQRKNSLFGHLLGQKNFFPSSLSPPAREHQAILHILLLLFSTDENDQNASPTCNKAITTGYSIWENGPLFYYYRYYTIFPPQFYHVRICDQHKKLLKRTQRGKDSGSAAAGGSAANSSAVGGGSATPSGAAGNTTQVGSTSPLKAALVLKVNFIELLPNASRPFLIPHAESALREFACLFYAEEKAKETKSDPSYILNSVKKLEIVFQAMPEVQESQGFKTLCNNLTLDLKKTVQ